MGIQLRVSALLASKVQYPGYSHDMAIDAACGRYGMPNQERDIIAKLRAQASAQAFKLRAFRLWTYDVWGNARDGFDVNDRYSHGTVTIRCKREVFNADTYMEFITYSPTDRQLSRAAGFKRASWEGSDGTYYAEDSRNGRPLGELCEREAQS